MTTTQVVETSVNNSQIQNFVHTDDHTRPTYDLLHRKRVTAISNIWSAAEEKQILLHRTRKSGFAIFFDKLIIWAPNTNLDRKINLKRKRDTENTGYFLAKANRFALVARWNHCNYARQTQLPQNEAPKQIASSLDRSGRKSSREPFIPAVGVLFKPYSYK